MTTREINLLHRDLFIKFGPLAVELISTHVSWVLLTPKFAYKIKKPVSFSFLDFSSLEKRIAACREEIRLNQRLTTGMYLGVVPIWEKKGRYAIDQGEGTIIEYALKMKRMDHSRQMDILLNKQLVSPEHLRATARKLADFHRTAEQLSGVTHLNQLKEQFNDIAIIQEFLKTHLGTGACNLVKESIHLSDQFLQENISHLQERERKGLVIDGHGDLHSRNIFLLDEPVIFDCIEFNEAFRQMDVLNEIAFLCMDLDFFGRQDLNAHFLDTYLSAIPCIETPEDWTLFHYFKLYRANVRLKVLTLNAMQANDQEELDSLIPEIESYLQLYQHYLKALS